MVSPEGSGGRVDVPMSVTGSGGGCREVSSELVGVSNGTVCDDTGSSVSSV
jgi:hypothetical protein